MPLKTYTDLVQGTQEWLDARCGIITASVVGKLITPSTLKPASNDTARGVMKTLIAERLTGYVEPIRPTADMERGTFDEPIARSIYAEHHAPVQEVGFMVRDDWGTKIGYSPDGLVGDDGLIEVKSRKQRYQLETILTGEVPSMHMAQIQCGLLVSGREWLDYISYRDGMPLWTKRVLPDLRWQEAIIAAAQAFESLATSITDQYLRAIEGLPPTERIDYDMMEIF
jgi:hypothetical protein